MKKTAALLFVIFALVACQRQAATEKDSEQVSVEDVGYLLVTYSMDSPSTKVDGFLNLGLIDIIATLDDGQQVVDFSLYGLDHSLLNSYFSSTPLMLWPFRPSTYQLIGGFYLPQGKITQVRLLISPMDSQFFQDGETINLFDSFNRPLARGNSTDFIKSTNHRSLPLETGITLSEPLEMEVNKSYHLDLAVDYQSSLAYDPTLASEGPAARLIPVITANTKASAQDEKTWHFTGKTTLTVKENQLWLGTHPEISFNYSLSDKSMLYVNGEPANELAQLSGQMFVDLSGQYSADGNQLLIEKMALYRLSDDSKQGLNFGWLDESNQLAGIYQPLDFSKDILPVKRTLSGKNEIEGTDWVLGFKKSQEDTEFSIIDVPDISSNDVQMMLTQGLTAHHPDMLGMAKLGKQEERGQNYVFSLPHPVECEQFFVDTKPCNASISTIQLPMNLQTQFTVVTSRQEAEVTDASGVFIAPFEDQIATRLNATDFVKLIKALVTENSYRILSLTAFGQVEGEDFIIHRDVKVVLLSPIDALDQETLQWLEEQSRKKNRGRNEVVVSPERLLLALGAASAVGGLSWFGWKLWQARQRSQKAARDNLLAAANAGGLVKQPYYRWNPKKFPKAYDGQGASPVFLSPDYRANQDKIQWREPTIPQKSAVDVVHSNYRLAGSGVTASDKVQYRAGQLVRKNAPITTNSTSGSTYEYDNRGVSFGIGNKALTIKTIKLIDRELDMSDPLNHPIFERGTGAYYLPKTQEQIDKNLPNDNLYFVNYQNQLSADDIQRNYEVTGGYGRDPKLLNNSGLSVQLGSNIIDVFDDTGKSVKDEIKAVALEAEVAHKQRQDQFSAQIKDLDQKFKADLDKIKQRTGSSAANKTPSFYPANWRGVTNSQQYFDDAQRKNLIQPKKK